MAIWICSLILKDASLVDRFWGSGFVLIAWVAAWVASPAHKFEGADVNRQYASFFPEWNFWILLLGMSILAVSLFYFINLS